jgi:hypothetical protein
MKNIDENNEEENDSNKNDDSSKNDSDNSAPQFPKLPPFIMDFINNIERQIGDGFHFPSVNVRVVGENELDTLPIEILQQILDRAVDDENYELAGKVRDVINSKK